MRLIRHKLGQLIERVETRNSDLKYRSDDVRGVSNNKEIQPTKADISDRAFDRFYVIHPKEFVFNRRTTRMGERLGLGYNNTGRTYIFTDDYVAFRVKDGADLLPDYLYIFFLRPEFDRYVRYDSWGSATEFFNWEEMCDVPIALPPKNIQQKYVDVYNALLTNRAVYAQGLENLNATITASIEGFKHAAPRMPIGDLLEEIDVRNHDRLINNVLGINIDKKFMPSIANLSETDLGTYKVIEKDQFAANFMHVMRDEKIPFSLYHQDVPCVISPAYSIFRMKSDKALPEYIMLWMNRSESDRYAWFISDSSIRGGLEKNRFFETKIPLPSIPQQRGVADLYNSRYLIQRNVTKLGALLKNICPILIKGSIEDAKVG